MTFDYYGCSHATTTTATATTAIITVVTDVTITTRVTTTTSKHQDINAAIIVNAVALCIGVSSYMFNTCCLYLKILRNHVVMQNSPPRLFQQAAPLSPPSAPRWREITEGATSVVFCSGSSTFEG